MAVRHGAALYDPAIKELQRLAELATRIDCPQEIKEGLQHALSLANRRDQFAEDVSSRSENLARVAEFTLTHDWEGVYAAGKSSCLLETIMLSGQLEGQFLKMIVSIQKPKRVMELGTYTGSGTVALAEALPPDGVLVTCDFEPYLEEVIRKNIAGLPNSKNIQIRIGKCQDTMRDFIAKGEQFDLIFIDAEKVEYPEYYKIALDEGLLAPGGTILIDNAFFFGEPYMLESTDPLVNPLRVLHDQIKNDPRVYQVLVPLRDGISIIRRREDVDTPPQ